MSLRNPIGDAEHVRGQLLVGIFHGFDMRLGQNQRVPGIDMADIHDRQHMLVLVNDVSG